jgi:hypothetical protein
MYKPTINLEIYVFVGWFVIIFKTTFFVVVITSDMSVEGFESRVRNKDNYATI